MFSACQGVGRAMRVTLTTGDRGGGGGCHNILFWLTGLILYHKKWHKSVTSLGSDDKSKVLAGKQVLSITRTL
jgi:hypothetical protein